MRLWEPGTQRGAEVQGGGSHKSGRGGGWLPAPAHSSVRFFRSHVGGSSVSMCVRFFRSHVVGSSHMYVPCLLLGTSGNCSTGGRFIYNQEQEVTSSLNWPVRGRDYCI